MFAKVSAGLDGSAVFCRNGAVKRIFMPCQHEQRPSENFQTALCGNRDAWSGTGFALSMRANRIDKKITASRRLVVARGGIEPPTHGFSIRCSTN